MKNNDLMERFGAANPVSPTAFQNVTDTPEGRETVERIFATPRRPPEESVSVTKAPAAGTGWMRRHRSIVAGALAVALILGVVAIVSFPKSDSDTSTAWAASLVKIAEGSPRLLVTKEDWKVVRADEVSARTGEMTFSDGQETLELRWTSAAELRNNMRQLEREAQAQWDMTIAGERVTLFQHEEDSTDFRAIWLDDNREVLLRGWFADVDDYRSVAATVERVDVNTWLSALPASVVQPRARASSVELMLADIPVHPTVDVEELKQSSNVQDRYQLGAEVTSAVTCAWIGQWVDAVNEGDDASAQEAVVAMSTARDWTILQQMNEEGGWAENIWAYADAMVENSPVPAGGPMSVEEGYRSAFGCDHR